MANNKWQNSSLFNIELTQTQRKLTAVTSETDRIVITTVSPFPSSVVAKSSSAPGSQIMLYSCGSWANGGPYEVMSRATNVLKLKKIGLTSGRSFATVPGSQAKVSVNGSITVSETRNTSNFAWNESALATTNLCSVQVKVKDILNKFWSNPEIALQFQSRFINRNDSALNWSTYSGPINLNDTSTAYGFSRDRFVNAYMCTVFAESTWNKRNSTTSDGKTYRGLFQIGPSSAGWQNNNSNFLTDIFDPEYNTRCALWLIYYRLFRVFEDTNSNPFMDWHALDRITPSGTYHNYIDCCRGSASCGNCAKYCNCSSCTGL